MIVAVCPKCGADLIPLTYTTYPPIHAYRCPKCGWSQEEKENITRVEIPIVQKMPKTNAGRIRAMTDEELAEWLFQAWHNSWYTFQEWLDWLRQEAGAYTIEKKEAKTK